MSLITKNNYEAFLLDYVEGNLSPEHTAELMLFFENNPELKEDLDDFALLTLDVPETQLKNKEANHRYIKRVINLNKLNLVLQLKYKYVPEEN